MNVKMIVTDLDETLLRTDKTISKKTIEILHKCQMYGVVIVIATARFWIGAERYINVICPDYAITADGTMIHNAEKIIYSCQFDLRTTNRLIHMIHEVNATAEIMTAIDKKVYWNNLHISESDKLYKAEYYDYKSPLLEAANKIVARLPDKNVAEDIAKKCMCRLISYRDENLYGFLPYNVGKLHTIQKLADILHISMDEIVAFGDDENDIDMLKSCGLGVAVSNAIPEVQLVADKLTSSNDEDGVAFFIEREIPIYRTEDYL
ncbi:MAG TPA: Cof-type HAD-IIB family hydrolase [Clostridiales bacterium]|nr:Cof-type HAD-IIB family hydrolase [Clostridiales bacterium]